TRIDEYILAREVDVAGCTDVPENCDQVVVAARGGDIGLAVVIEIAKAQIVEAGPRLKVDLRRKRAGGDATFSAEVRKKLYGSCGRAPRCRIDYADRTEHRARRYRCGDELVGDGRDLPCDTAEQHADLRWICTEIAALKGDGFTGRRMCFVHGENDRVLGMNATREYSHQANPHQYFDFHP